jgi:hypothetical protein
MPFEITNQGGFLFLRLFGVVTAQDLMRAVEQAEVMEGSLPVAMNAVTDITSVESFDINYPAVLAVAARRRARVVKNPVKSALIAREAVAVGFARMFQTLNDNPQVEIRIVQSLQEAKNWFAGNPSGSQP